MSIALENSPEVMLYHGETVSKDGVCVGDVRAGDIWPHFGLPGGPGTHHVPGLAGRRSGQQEVFARRQGRLRWQVLVIPQNYPWVRSTIPRMPRSRPKSDSDQRDFNKCRFYTSFPLFYKLYIEPCHIGENSEGLLLALLPTYCLCSLPRSSIVHLSFLNPSDLLPTLHFHLEGSN